MPSQSSERTLLEIDVKRGIVHHVEAVAESAESRVKKGKSQAVASFALSLSPPPPPPPPPPSPSSLGPLPGRSSASSCGLRAVVAVSVGRVWGGAREKKREKQPAPFFFFFSPPPPPPPPAPLSLSACSHSLLFVRSDSDYDEFDSSDQWGARGAGVSVRELLTCSHSDIAIMSLSLAPYLSLSFPPTPSPSPPLCVHSLCVLVVWLQVAGVSSCRR
eukprot:COSAG03_NODE_229_length_10305_cov_30.967085_10_plen_217_part_00